MKEWMAQADPPKEARTFERMGGRSQPISSDKMANYFKEWTTAIVFSKKIYRLYENSRFNIYPLKITSSLDYSMPKEN